MRVRSASSTNRSRRSTHPRAHGRRQWLQSTRRWAAAARQCGGAARCKTWGHMRTGRQRWAAKHLKRGWERRRACCLRCNLALPDGSPAPVPRQLAMPSQPADVVVDAPLLKLSGRQLGHLKGHQLRGACQSAGQAIEHNRRMLEGHDSTGSTMIGCDGQGPAHAEV